MLAIAAMHTMVASPVQGGMVCRMPYCMVAQAYRGCFKFNRVCGIFAAQARQLVQNLVAVEVYVKAWPSVLLIQQGLDFVAPI